MAAPTPQVRGAITAVLLQDGFQTLLASSLGLTISISEKSVQIGAIDGGDAIVTTTMLNVLYETKAPQCLQMWEDWVVIAAYDPHAYTLLQSMLNQPQTITAILPDDTSLTAYAYLKRVESAPLVKGTMPEVTMTWVITNFDPVHCVEAGPVLTLGAGSCSPC